MKTQFIDLHIHPAMKPLGKSFNSTPGKNSSNKNRSNSIWHYDPPTAPDKLVNITTTLTKFRQSDFTSLAKGGADVVVVSLCGLEKGFVITNLGTSLPGDVAGNLVTGLKMMGRTADPDEILGNIDKVKQWDHRLYMVGLTHHFNNEMVGHAQSLHGVVRKMCNQNENMNEGFNDLGWQVLRKLLDNSNGRRAVIDLKHMSVKARKEYYDFLEREHAGEIIPLVVSHGAVNGLRSFSEKVEDDPFTQGKFQPDDINIFDHEIVRIARSGGLLGIQFDERRVASEMELKKTGRHLNRRKMLFHQSKLIWNQIQHIAEVLNRHDLFAWDIQCIGSDNDGMVNPLNGFWTAEEMPLFDSYLEKHAYNFIASAASDNLKSYNKMTASEIVERFMHGNAYHFLKKNF